MEQLKFEKPTVELKRIDKNVFEYKITPLDRGYGITVGHALKRVLLSSIPGAAIVNVKIDGVEHEFSTIPGIKEDVMGIILNLRQIIFTVDSNDPDFEQTLELEVEGEKEVKAEDFNKVTGVNIINPNLVIANLNSEGKLKMEVTLRKGIGYVSFNDNKKFNNNRFGVIAIDSHFSPIKKVSYKVDKIRGDNDLLIMNIETNGAIEGEKILPLASKMLVDYLNTIVETSQEAFDFEYIIEKKEQVKENKLDMGIDKLNLTVRLYNSLKRSGIYTISQIVNETEDNIMHLRSLGKKSFRELKEKLKDYGLTFASDILGDEKNIEEEEE